MHQEPLSFNSSQLSFMGPNTALSQHRVPPSKKIAHGGCIFLTLNMFRMKIDVHHFPTYQVRRLDFHRTTQTASSPALWDSVGTNPVASSLALWACRAQTSCQIEC